MSRASSQARHPRGSLSSKEHIHPDAGQGQQGKGRGGDLEDSNGGAMNRSWSLAGREDEGPVRGTRWAPTWRLGSQGMVVPFTAMWPKTSGKRRSWVWGVLRLNCPWGAEGTYRVNSYFRQIITGTWNQRSSKWSLRQAQGKRPEIKWKYLLVCGYYKY